MAMLRIRYQVPGDAPGHWRGELKRDEEVPDLGEDLVLSAEGGPRRYRVVALLFKATLAVIGIDADVYVASADPATPPPSLVSLADGNPGPD